MEGAVDFSMNGTLQGKTVAIQGAGNVGKVDIVKCIVFLRFACRL